MGCLTCEGMQLLERRAFGNGATPEGLMEKAGRGIAEALMRRYPRPGRAVACIGSGNNGGDALVALKYLARAGWAVSVRCAVEQGRLRALPRKKWRELGTSVRENGGAGNRILLDGLLGIGANGALREPLAGLAAWMNRQRCRHDTDVVAMDIPSGIDGDTGEPSGGAVVADLTLAVGVPKRGLLMPAAVNHTGALETVPVVDLPVPGDGDLFLNDVHSLCGLLPRRPHDFHKGNAGRVGVVAGSRGMLGAAVLCASAALRAGAGLVTLYCLEENYPVLAPMLPPEVMLAPVGSLSEIDLEMLDVLAVGPGMGSAGDDAFFDMLERSTGPVVIDADGLNRIARAGAGRCLRPGMVVTPHPGEMRRLFPQSETMGRLETVRGFARSHPGVCLLFKGARSLVSDCGDTAYVNGSGHAGMAGAGQGDVLTGVIAALAGQGVGTLESARLAAWLCGRSAELAVSHGGQSAQSLTAGDVIAHLGAAFRELR